ncbi:MAG TPA: nitrite/sulfite reductase [Saprospiraceae bacterium]|nr:nitrite/sulfite reductase [Saprospiraceae bacterium]
MQSFRTELENPTVEKDIIELERKIHLFRTGQMDEDRFRSLRLARGVYGQRQPGVQMVRIKIPYGKLSSQQLESIADVCDEYSTGNLHITTRQDIQIHYVSLDRTPELWAELERSKVTLREACGNTVRNVTASPWAGIDPAEPFDVSPYAQAYFEYFLRNPICQEMGRKFKVSFSSSERDDAFSFVHDLGFIPKIKDGKRGFKVMLGGGIGSQPRHADVMYEFLPTDQIIPMGEAVLRLFDHYGERLRRNKARMKFLIKDWGLETFMEKLNQELQVLGHDSIPIDGQVTSAPNGLNGQSVELQKTSDEAFEAWKKVNVKSQKQSGYYAVGIKVNTGDFSTETARKFTKIVRQYAADDIRLTATQGILLRYVAGKDLPALYRALKTIDFAKPGFESIADIVACPGTDTCNLGIASSMGLAKELGRMLEEEYTHFIMDRALSIKISGCMNACGQHTIANIGFQGMTLKSNGLVAPATQILLGGGVLGDGQGRFADKLIKIPSRRTPEALRLILNDFDQNTDTEANFLDYYDEQGKDYFYQMLKPLSDSDDLKAADFIDWGNEAQYEKAIGIGECAGVTVDLVATLIMEAEEKMVQAKAFLDQKQWADAIYASYTGIINAAKALLTGTDAKLRSQAAIVRNFDQYFGELSVPEGDLSTLIQQMKTCEPEAAFAQTFFQHAQSFLTLIIQTRHEQLQK